VPAGTVTPAGGLPWLLLGAAGPLKPCQAKKKPSEWVGGLTKRESQRTSFHLVFGLFCSLFDIFRTRLDAMTGFLHPFFGR